MWSSVLSIHKEDTLQILLISPHRYLSPLKMILLISKYYGLVFRMVHYFPTWFHKIMKFLCPSWNRVTVQCTSFYTHTFTHSRIWLSFWHFLWAKAEHQLCAMSFPAAATTNLLTPSHLKESSVVSSHLVLWQETSWVLVNSIWI